MAKLADAKPLAFPIVGHLVSNLAVGVTGFLLMLSGLFSGWRFSLFMLPAAFIAMFGSTFGIPEITFLGIPDLSAMAVAGVLFVVGFMFRD